MPDTKEVKLESSSRGALTVKGDLTSQEFGAVIYSLSEDRGFTFVLQSVIGMVTDADEFDDEMNRVVRFDDEELTAYLKELLQKDLEPGDYSLKVELVHGAKAEISLAPTEYTVRGMMTLIFGLCTLENAGNLVAEMEGYSVDEED